MAALTLHDTSRSIEITFSPAGADQTVPNPRGKSKLIVDNQGMTEVTVTATAVSTNICGYKHDLSETVGAGKVKCILLDRTLNNTSAEVPITYSSVESVTVCAIE